MGLSRWIESYTGDLDTFCAYRTSRTLMIRDRRLGITLFAMQFAIFIYVVVWQLALSQVYLAQSDFNGVVRLQLKAPSNAYRWPQGLAPYCLAAGAVNATYPLAAGYAVNGDGTFTKDGATFAQRHCQFLDETAAVPIPETDRMFLTSETRVTAQSAPLACAQSESIDCQFTPAYNRNDDNVTRRSFVADVEFFTLLIGASCSARPAASPAGPRAASLFPLPPSQTTT